MRSAKRNFTKYSNASAQPICFAAPKENITTQFAASPIQGKFFFILIQILLLFLIVATYGLKNVHMN